jgi:hypothetical protein
MKRERENTLAKLFAKKMFFPKFLLKNVQKKEKVRKLFEKMPQHICMS